LGRRSIPIGIVWIMVGQYIVSLVLFNIGLVGIDAIDTPQPIEWTIYWIGVTASLLALCKLYGMEIEERIDNLEEGLSKTT
jgi:hypothetical protein